MPGPVDIRGQRMEPELRLTPVEQTPSELAPTDRERSSIPRADGWKIGSLGFTSPLTVGASRLESEP